MKSSFVLALQFSYRPLPFSLPAFDPEFAPQPRVLISVDHRAESPDYDLRKLRVRLLDLRDGSAVCPFSFFLSSASADADRPLTCFPFRSLLLSPPPNPFPNLRLRLIRFFRFALPFPSTTKI